MCNQVRVAVVQAASALFDKEAGVAKVASLTKEAAEKGARIVLFPEAFLPCYPRGMSFGCNVGKRTDKGRKEFRKYFEESVEIPGPEMQAMAQTAADNGVYLCVGIIERDGGTLYCTIVYFGPDGSYLGKHRKLKPTAAERLIWGEGDGSTLTTVDTPFGRMGGSICWETYMPLLRSAMYAKGLSFYLTPTADSREVWQSTIRHIALESRCFVLNCNQFVSKDMVTPDMPGYDEMEHEDDILCRGGSAIIDPMGNYLAGPLFGSEGILVADLDLGRLAEARFDFDPVGHYSRPDVFTLLVNEEPLDGAEFVEG